MSSIERVKKVRGKFVIAIVFVVISETEDELEDEADDAWEWWREWGIGE